MSLNDRCQEALSVLDVGGRIDYPEVRTLVRSILQDGADGIAFPEGIREAARAIREQNRPICPGSRRPPDPPVAVIDHKRTVDGPLYAFCSHCGHDYVLTKSGNLRIHREPR